MKTRKICAALLILTVLLAPAVKAFGVDYPGHTDNFYVNDYANVIDAETEQYIMSVAVALEQKTKAQVVVLTIGSLDGDSIENYAYRVFTNWGIGDKDLNNGVLILVAIDDRKSRIEVGYGLEGALPDGKTGRIQDDYMLPHFRENDYATGIKKGFQAIVNEIYQEYGIEKNIGGINVASESKGTKSSISLYNSRHDGLSFSGSCIWYTDEQQRLWIWMVLADERVCVCRVHAICGNRPANISL